MDDGLRDPAEILRSADFFRGKRCIECRGGDERAPRKRCSDNKVLPKWDPNRANLALDIGKIISSDPDFLKLIKTDISRFAGSAGTGALRCAVRWIRKRRIWSRRANRRLLVFLIAPVSSLFEILREGLNISSARYAGHFHLKHFGDFGDGSLSIHKCDEPSLSLLISMLWNADGSRSWRNTVLRLSSAPRLCRCMSWAPGKWCGTICGTSAGSGILGSAVSWL